MRRKIIMIILLLLIIVSFFAIKTVIANNTSVNIPELELEEIEKTYAEQMEELDDNSVYSDNTEIFNVLLLGLDGSGYGKDKRSDVVIIATIDSKNKSLKLTSVARDTLTYHPSKKIYDKLNHAYPRNGAKEVVDIINTNLDLDIEDYITFDYDSVIKAVDFIGGYPADMTIQEARDMGSEGEKLKAGQQILSGKDAITYMRIRKNSGGDPGRNQRQRDLIVYIMQEAQQMNKVELLKFATTMLPLVKTSYTLFDVKELLDLYVNIRGGLEVDQYTYPFEYKGGILSDKLWYAVPRTVETNVKQFHEEVLGKPYYDVPTSIEEISHGIIEKSGVK